jgi:UDP-3-O-[3-hydroxymyristoyl] glucosamine N-acyltransferase
VQRTVQELAALVQARVHGDGSRLIGGGRPLDGAGAGDVTFIEADRYLRHLAACQASAVVLPAALVSAQPQLLASLPSHLSILVVEDALAAFVTLVRHLRGDADEAPTGVDPRAAVHPSAILGPDVSVHPFAVIGEGTLLGARCRVHAGVVIGRRCRLGDDVTLYPHAVLYDGVIVGHRVIVHSHAVLGADGFGYRLHEGRHVKVPQFGCVEIGDDVEVGAGTTIDRGTFQPTRVGTGTKIDNLVMIGHNCQIGRHNMLVSQVGIAGSCTTGDYVVMAGQVGVADHLHIGDRAVIGARAGLHRDVPAGERILGAPGRPESEAKRILLSLDHLPDLRRDVKAIKQHLGLDRPSSSERAAG